MKRHQGQGFSGLLLICCFIMVMGITFSLNGSAWGIEKKRAQPYPANEKVSKEKGKTIPYVGKLTNASGQPVTDGRYNFVFTLYDKETGGSALWSESRPNLFIKGGDLITALGGITPLLSGLAASQALWLEIRVQGPGEAGFTSLSPRQQLNTASAAVTAVLQCPHSHFEDSWDGSSSLYGLSVNNTSSGDGIRAYTNGSSANYASLYGENFGSGTGTYGRSDGGGDGVLGESDTDDPSKGGVRGAYTGVGGGCGVVGETISTTTLSAGVYAKYGATSGNGQAIYTDVFSPDAWAGWFQSSGHGLHISAGGAGKTGLEVFNGTKSAVVRTREGHRLLYTEESTGVWFTDYGFGRLKAGQTVITVDPLFAQTINTAEPYHVFIQAYGDAQLIVSRRGPTEFQVTARQGDPNAEFSYRIVAKRLGFEQARLESAPWADKDRTLSLEKQAGEIGNPADHLVLKQEGEK